MLSFISYITLEELNYKPKGFQNKDLEATCTQWVKKFEGSQPASVKTNNNFSPEAHLLRNNFTEHLYLKAHLADSRQLWNETRQQSCAHGE